nr:hypothetical protein [uncultured Pseudodesulfovibrio sp.]
MPAIEQTQFHGTNTDIVRDRIQELKARAAEGLDDAMNIVSKNLGREEAKSAENSLAGLGEGLTSQDAAIHTLDPLKVLDLISDPFEND